MRITENRIFGNLLRDLKSNRKQLARLQDAVSSGKIVRKASDGALKFSNSRLIEDRIRRNDQYQNNINSALQNGRNVQNALDGILDQLINLKKVSVQGATGTMSIEDRKSLADQVANIRKDIIGLANTKDGNKYLMAGTNSAEKPFKDVDSSLNVADSSNNDPLKARIQDGVDIAYTITAKELRTTRSGDLFKLLKNVENALRNDDPTAVNSEMDHISDAIDHVTNLAARVGNNINRMEFAGEQYQALRIDQKGEVSKLVDTDYAQAMSEVKQYQIAYQAALSVHSTITQTNLMDYLR